MVETLPLESVTAEVGLNVPTFAAIAEIDGDADVGLSGIGVDGLDLNGSGQRGANGSSLGVAAGNVQSLKQSVGFKAILRADIDLAVGDGLSDKMADGRQRVASWGPDSCRRAVERTGVKGEELDRG